ncbi:MAG: D-alanine--D-alanine ligase [Verrucomicrobia bacterium]|nr:D-alanine--D-alanine ligase [Verrucomicrobiota bacterium]
MKIDPKQLKVAVLGGGPGSERDVSLASADAVVKALEGEVGKVSLVDVRDSGFLLPSDTDIAFNVIHGTYGEDGALQAEMESRGIAYTGAREVSSRLAFDKVESKKSFVKENVKTPLGETLSGPYEKPDSVHFPCVVKPPSEGSSVGVHIIKESDEWTEAVEDAAKYGASVLVEEYIKGKELTVGIVGDQVLPVIHIEPKSGFYDMKNKYPWLLADGGTDYHCPADLPAEVTKMVQSLAWRAHCALGVEVYSRVDLLLNDKNQAYVLELNTIPGMTKSSLLPKAAKEAGVTFSALCLKIIELSLIIHKDV